MRRSSEQHSGSPAAWRAAAVESAFAVLWFSWVPEDAPDWLRTASLAGAIAALVVFVAALVRRRRGTAGADIRSRYLRVIAVEAAAIVVAVLVVGGDWLPVAVAFIVGLHFFPLGRLFPAIGLMGLGVAVVLVAAAALVAGLASSADPGAIAGPGTGACLLAAAVYALTR